MQSHEPGVSKLPEALALAADEASFQTVKFKRPSEVDLVTDQLTGKTYQQEGEERILPAHILDSAKLAPHELLALYARMESRFGKEHQGTTNAEPARLEVSRRFDSLTLDPKADASLYIAQLLEMGRHLYESALSFPNLLVKGVAPADSCDRTLMGEISKSFGASAVCYPFSPEIERVFSKGLGKLLVPHQHPGTFQRLERVEGNDPFTALVLDRTLQGAADFQGLSALLTAANNAKPPFREHFLRMLSEKEIPSIALYLEREQQRHGGQVDGTLLENLAKNAFGSQGRTFFTDVCQLLSESGRKKERSGEPISQALLMKSVASCLAASGDHRAVAKLMGEVAIDGAGSFTWQRTYEGISVVSALADEVNEIARERGATTGPIGEIYRDGLSGAIMKALSSEDLGTALRVAVTASALIQRGTVPGLEEGIGVRTDIEERKKGEGNGFFHKLHPSVRLILLATNNTNLTAPDETRREIINILASHKQGEPNLLDDLEEVLIDPRSIALNYGRLVGAIQELATAQMKERNKWSSGYVPFSLVLDGAFDVIKRQVEREMREGTLSRVLEDTALKTRQKKFLDTFPPLADQESILTSNYLGLASKYQSIPLVQALLAVPNLRANIHKGIASGEEDCLALGKFATEILVRACFKLPLEPGATSSPAPRYTSADLEGAVSVMNTLFRERDDFRDTMTRLVTQNPIPPTSRIFALHVLASVDDTVFGIDDWQDVAEACGFGIFESFWHTGIKGLPKK